MIYSSKEALNRWIRWCSKQHMVEDTCGNPGLHLFSLCFVLKPNIPEYAKWN